MQSRPSQGRSEVIEDHRLGTAFGLTALPGVVDDERVKVGKRAQSPLREAGIPQANPLSRQPLQVAVLAHVHHHVGSE